MIGALSMCAILKGWKFAVEYRREFAGKSRTIAANSDFAVFSRRKVAEVIQKVAAISLWGVPAGGGQERERGHG